jgi:trigger factor
MQGIKVNALEKKPCEASFRVEIQSSIINTEMENIFADLQTRAVVEGFRQGKAPIDLIKKKFVSHAKELLVDNFVKDTIFKVLDEQKVKPVSPPFILDLKFKDDDALDFSFNVDVAPEFKVKDYKGIKLNKEPIIVNDDEVNKFIDMYRERGAKLVEDTSNIVNNKSAIMMDYEMQVEGKEKKDSVKNAFVSLETNNIIPGLKDNLIGLKLGETKNIELTLPQDYHEKSLAGKKIFFNVFVKEIKRKELPELNEEFVKLYGFDSVDSFKKYTKEIILKDKEHKLKHDVENQIISHLVTKNDFQVPKYFVARQLEHIVEQQEKHSNRKLTDQEREELKNKNTEHALKTVKLFYILNAIAEKENILVEENDFEARIQEVLKENNHGAKEPDVRDYFTKNKENVMAQLKEEKIFKFLEKNAG